MNFRIVNEVSEKKWEDYVLNHPYSNPFQMPWMYNFFENVTGYQPFKIFVVGDKYDIKGCLIAVIIKEGDGIKGKLSSRTIVSGGPLIDFNDGNASDIFRILVKALVDKVSKSSIYIEFRNFFQYEDIFIRQLEEVGFEFEENINFIVNLKKQHNPFKYLSESKRRQIKRAMKEGSEVVVAKTLNEVKQLYDIMVDLYKNRAKKPLADWSFFKEFYIDCCSNEKGLYLIVKKENAVIGGIMCIAHNNTLYEWYVCGLDREYKYNYPSVIATWAAIEYGFKNGFHFFDFLGAGNPNEKYGVREFKAKFGGDVFGYGRYIRINYPFVYELGKLFVKIYSRFF